MVMATGALEKECKRTGSRLQHKRPNCLLQHTMKRIEQKQFPYLSDRTYAHRFLPIST
jgi:hypothetical protein